MTYNRGPGLTPIQNEDPHDPEAIERARLLGLRLKTMFNDVVEEPVPDDFLDLLNRLDGSEAP